MNFGIDLEEWNFGDSTTNDKYVFFLRFELGVSFVWNVLTKGVI